MIFNSIRARLQIWYGIILVVLLAGFGITTFQLEHTRQLCQVDDELTERAALLFRELRQPDPDRPGQPDPDRPRRPRLRDLPPEDRRGGEFPPQDRRDGPFPPAEFPGFLELRNLEALNATDIHGFYHAVWKRDGEPLARSTNSPPDLGRPARVENRIPTFRSHGNFRELYQFTPPGECILIGRSIEKDLTALRLLAWKLTGIGAAILLVGIAGGGWIAKRALRPVATISGTAEKIAAGDLSQRINVVDTDDELGQLAGVLNSTFARLDAAFAQQAQFTSDAAHELRTPVSVMLTQTQGALTRERSAAEYRETVEACQRAAQRMRRLIELLLRLARLDAGQETMKQIRFDLSQTARECIEQVRPLGTERNICIHEDLKETECNGDSEFLAQVITNLLSNAIHYNCEGGQVQVSTETQDGTAVLTVADTGLGIGAEDLPHIFDRFYRGDKSRTGSAGRTGLGLAISKAIVEAHRGTIEVTSEPGKGTIFVVRLPNEIRA